MSIIATKPLVPYWYKPKESTDDDTVRFRVRGLTTTELMDMTASAIVSEDEDGNPKLRYGSSSMAIAIGRGLVGWEGFNSADGEAVAFPNNAKEKINLLGHVLAPEIFWEIVGASYLNEEQRKN